MRRDVLMWDAASEQHIREVLGTVDAVIVDHLGGVEIAVHGEQFLRVPDQDRQVRASQRRQRQLAGRIGQADDQQGLDAGRFMPGDDRVNLFSPKCRPIEPHVGNRRQRRHDPIDQPTLASLAQRGAEFLVEFESQGQQPDLGFPFGFR